MKPKFFHAVRRDVFAPLFLITFAFSSLPAAGQWIGAGAGGAGTVVNDLANWTGATINGDFSTVVAAGATNLTLSGEIAFSNATAVTATLATPFASAATTFEVADATGIVVGAKISGTGITLGSYVREIAGNVITPSISTSAASTGSYTFTPPALNFNFGDSATSGVTTASGVSLQIGSDVPGTERVLRVTGSALMGQRTNPANEIVTSADIKWVLNNGAIAFGRMGGDAGTTPTSPTMTINGPVDLGTFAFSNSRFVLEGGNVTVNGKISGGLASGTSINFGSSTNALTLLLTNPANDFVGTVSTNGFGTLTASATVPIADGGIPSALGAGTTITLGTRALNLEGFSNPLSTNRTWNTGTGGRINNNGTAPVTLSGPIRGSSTTASFNLGGSFADFSRPGLVTGQAINATGTSTNLLGITVGAGVWQPLNETNSFTRPATVTGANSALRFASVGNSGVASPLGAGTAITLSTATTSGAANFLEFVGEQNVSTNRSVDLGGNVSSSTTNAIMANGTGLLTLAGPLTSAPLTVNGNGTRTLRLDGIGNGLITGEQTLIDKTASSSAEPPVITTAKVALAKRGSGTWTLAGTGFNHTGATNIQSGHLILDYSVNDQFTADPASSAGIVINHGLVTLRAKPAGITTETWPAVTLGDSATGAADYNSTVLKFQANGGSGVDLTFASLAAAGNVMRADLLDLSDSSGHTLKWTALGTAVQVQNGVITTSSSGRNTLVIRDQTGYAFPTWDAVTGLVGKLSGQLPLPLTGYSNTTHYLLNTAGLAAPTANVTYATLTIDSSAGDTGISLGTRTLGTSGTGRGVLLSGANNVQISGSTANATFMSGSTFLHNYLESPAAFNLNANLGVSQPLILGGTGYTNYTGSGFCTGSSSTAGLSVLGGIFRASLNQDITAVVSRVRFSNAIFEIGADLNGVLPGDFSNVIASEAAATGATPIPGAFAFYYGSGISAANGNRTVNFGGAGAELVWATAGFLTAGDTESDGGYPLRLSSPRSDATITLENPINLNGNTTHARRRVIEVANGSAATDAVLSGVISGSADLVKLGAGTLLLSGANTYTGDTVVNSGKLLLGNGIATGSGRVFINGSGTIGGSGAAGATTINGTLEVALNGATSSTLNVTGDLTIANGASIAVSVLAAPTLTSYVIAEYTGIRTGTFTNVPAGYSVDYSQANKVLLVVSGTPVNAFTTWIGGFFPGVTDPLVVGPGADPDGDGLKNAVEFVLNRNPKDGGQGAVPAIVKSGSNAIFTFSRRKDAATAGYVSSVETSTTLLPLEWLPVGAGIVVVDNANPLLEDVTVTIPIPGNAPKFFARLKVTY